MSAFGGKADIPAYAASLQKAQRDAAAIIEEAKAQAERILASAEGRASRLTEPPRKQKKKIA
jgi:cell division septum initiation protein DivIVA